MIAVTNSKRLFRLFSLAYGLLKYAYVVLISRSSHVESVRWSLGKFDAGWREFPVAASFLASTDVLYPVHFEVGMISVEDSPHLAFVAAVVNPMSHDSRGLEMWRGYVRRQDSCSSEELDQRESRFRALIEAAQDDDTQFEILVDWRPLVGGFRVVDGFHRLACLAALRPGQLIRCWIAC